MHTEALNEVGQAVCEVCANIITVDRGVECYQRTGEAARLRRRRFGRASAVRRSSRSVCLYLLANHSNYRVPNSSKLLNPQTKLPIHGTGYYSNSYLRALLNCRL
jgi:hypothetical protein